MWRQDATWDPEKKDLFSSMIFLMNSTAYLGMARQFLRFSFSDRICYSMMLLCTFDKSSLVREQGVGGSQPVETSPTPQSSAVPGPFRRAAASACRGTVELGRGMQALEGIHG